MLTSLLALCQLATADVPVQVDLSAPLHFRSASELVSASGLRYELPPVYVISEAHWNSLDAEMKRLEAAEVRLRAENLELRRVSDTPVLGWVILAVVSMGTGVAVGAWLGD